MILPHPSRPHSLPRRLLLLATLRMKKPKVLRVATVAYGETIGRHRPRVMVYPAGSGDFFIAQFFADVSQLCY